MRSGFTTKQSYFHYAEIVATVLFYHDIIFTRKILSLLELTVKLDSPCVSLLMECLGELHKYSQSVLSSVPGSLRLD